MIRLRTHTGARRLVLAALIAAACAWASASAREPDAPATPRAVPREELVKVFAGLRSAAEAAGTFRAELRRSETSGLVVDEEPLVSEGSIVIRRPDRLRQELTDPGTGERKSLTVADSKDLWLHVPEAREVQHVDLPTGVKGRKGTSLRSMMPWFTFDLEELEKDYRVRAFEVEAPEAVAIRIVPPEKRSGISEEGIADLPAMRPEKCFRVHFRPVKRKGKAARASTVREITLWVDGVHPWALRFEQRGRDETVVTTEFREIVLEAPVPDERFRFRAPRGTKVVELSG